jgi:hypothetical protein
MKYGAVSTSCPLTIPAFLSVFLFAGFAGNGFSPCILDHGVSVGLAGLILVSQSIGMLFADLPSGIFIGRFGFLRTMGL